MEKAPPTIPIPIKLKPGTHLCQNPGSKSSPEKCNCHTRFDRYLFSTSYESERMEKNRELGEMTLAEGEKCTIYRASCKKVWAITFMVGQAFLPVINGLKALVRDRQECLSHRFSTL